MSYGGGGSYTDSPGGSSGGGGGGGGGGTGSVSADQCDYVFKFIIIGDTGTGKSCAMHQFIEGSFKPGVHKHTIGVEYGSKVITLAGKVIKLQIWDTAGQERFRSVTRSYYRNAAAALIFYAINDSSTFDHLNSWLVDSRQMGRNDISVVVAGNKSDLKDERQVTFLDASRFAQESEALFLETSALTGENVEEVFLKAARSVLSKIESGSAIILEQTNINIADVEPDRMAEWDQLAGLFRARDTSNDGRRKDGALWPRHVREIAGRGHEGARHVLGQTDVRARVCRSSRSDFSSDVDHAGLVAVGIFRRSLEVRKMVCGIVVLARDGRPRERAKHAHLLVLGAPGMIYSVLRRRKENERNCSLLY